MYFVVKAFEKAGMAAIMIEDQVWPKRCGHMAGKSVIPAEEMVQKIKAAADARSDSTFVIKARTDAAAPLGLDEAIRRLKYVRGSGADCLFADALSSKADIEKVARSVQQTDFGQYGTGYTGQEKKRLLILRRNSRSSASRRSAIRACCRRLRRKA